MGEFQRRKLKEKGVDEIVKQIRTRLNLTEK